MNNKVLLWSMGNLVSSCPRLDGRAVLVRRDAHV